MRMRVKSIVKRVICLIVLLTLGFSRIDLVGGKIEYENPIQIVSPNPDSQSNFGYSIEVTEDLVIVGEVKAKVEPYSSAGRVHVFNHQGVHLYSLQSPAPNYNNMFGKEVVSNGEQILVSEPHAIVDNKNLAGKVYLYSKDGELLETFVSPEPEPNGYFGWGISLSENKLVVGEPDAQRPRKLGRAYLYSKNGTFLTELLNYSAPQEEVYNFCNAAGMSENIIVVGEAKGDDRAGRVYLFDPDGQYIKKFQEPEPEMMASFGYRVDTHGERIVVSSNSADVDEMDNAGEAFIYDAQGNIIKSIASPNPGTGNQYGCSVAVDDSMIVVGEHLHDGTFVNEGRAYVYDLDGNLLHTLAAPEPSGAAEFGWAVDVHNGVIAVSEYNAKVEDESRAGKVYLFGLGESTAEPSVEKETTEPELEPDTDDTGAWIPGFPVVALALGLICTTIFITQRKR